MKPFTFLLCLPATLLSLVNAGCHKSPSNEAPVANAGDDINIEIPVNSAKLSGSMHDPDGEKPKFVWFKISGPETYFIAGNQLSPMVSSMGEGIYEYVLRVIDTKGLYSQDTVRVTVSSNLRKYIVYLNRDVDGYSIADIPEDVKNNLKYVFVKSFGACKEAVLLSQDYLWDQGIFYYSLFPDNKIEIFNDYDCEQAIIYY